MKLLRQGSAEAKARCSSCGKAGARRRARVEVNARLVHRTLCHPGGLAAGFNYSQGRPLRFDRFEEAA
jgi:hypothetical protein